MYQKSWTSSFQLMLGLMVTSKWTFLLVTLTRCQGILQSLMKEVALVCLSWTHNWTDGICLVDIRLLMPWQNCVFTKYWEHAEETSGVGFYQQSADSCENWRVGVSTTGFEVTNPKYIAVGWYGIVGWVFVIMVCVNMQRPLPTTGNKYDAPKCIQIYMKPRTIQTMYFPYISI